MKFTTQRIEENTFDKETGEVFSSKIVNTTVHKVQDKEFTMVFEKTPKPLCALDGNSAKLCLYLIQFCIDLNNNRISFTSVRKKEACKEMDVSSRTLYRAIETLCSENILTKISVDTYEYNKEYFWRGSLANWIKSFDNGIN